MVVVGGVIELRDVDIRLKDKGALNCKRAVYIMHNHNN